MTTTTQYNRDPGYGESEDEELLEPIHTTTGNITRRKAPMAGELMPLSRRRKIGKVLRNSKNLRFKSLYKEQMQWTVFFIFVGFFCAVYYGLYHHAGYISADDFHRRRL
mmetsp:Transcript_6420/g.13063  ORF Transcript_6420/g.13063 Transcript_6420/m.13063 type:complete len:109 (-) Transcript_6420:186-512(-)